MQSRSQSCYQNSNHCSRNMQKYWGNFETILYHKWREKEDANGNFTKHLGFHSPVFAIERKNGVKKWYVKLTEIFLSYWNFLVRMIFYNRVSRKESKPLWFTQDLKRNTEDSNLNTLRDNTENEPIKVIKNMRNSLAYTLYQIHLNMLFL